MQPILKISLTKQRKVLVMKKIFTCIFCALVAISLNATGPILSESFSYNLGNLYGNGGWIKYSTNANEPIQVINNPLTYTGYQDNAVGYAVELAGTNNKDQCLWKQFSADPITVGSVYYSFLMNMKSVGSNASGVFFATLVSEGKNNVSPGDGVSVPTTVGYEARLFAGPSTNTGKFKLAVTKNGASITTSSPATQTMELDLATTYLVVVKYTWVKGTKNDIVQVWVNPNKDAEPATASLTATDNSADLTYGIIGLELRQGGVVDSYTNRPAPDVIIDQIRMAQNWADLFVQATGGDTPSTDPIISPSPTNLTFENFKVGETNQKTISITAANLTEDITITKTTDAISLSKTSITLDELTAGSVSVEVTINANQEADFTDVITFTSGETVEEVNVTATVWEPAKEDVISFEALLNKTSTTDIIFTYKGTSARIFNVTKDNNQIVLIDNSGKTVTVQLTDALWENIQPSIGMKVKKFVFTAEFIGTPSKAICTPTILEFKDADYTREVTNLNIGTICFKGIVNPSVLDNIDATFYKILYKQEYEGEVYNIVLEEVTELAENTPYIFQPNSIGTMKFYTTMGSEENAKSANGLIGTFTKIESAVDNVLVGKYLIANNMFCKAGEYCSLAANRAYIDIDQVPTEENAAPKVGMRHINLQNADARQLPTNLNETQTHNSVRKAIINGQFVILHNNKAFNAIGAEIQ